MATRSPLRNPLRSAIRSALRLSEGLLCEFLVDSNGEFVLDANGQAICLIEGPTLIRFFTDLVASGSMYNTIPTVTLPSHFDYSFSVYAPNTADFTTILSGLAPGGARVLRITSSGFIEATSGSMVLTGTVDIRDAKLHIIRVTRVGQAQTIYVDGVLDATSSSSSALGDVIISDVGRRSNNSSYLTGILANLSIDDAGTPIRFYALDENFGITTVAVDSISGQNGTAVNISSSELYTQDGADFLGVERVVNGTFNTDINGWTDTSSAGGSIAWNPLKYIDLINGTGTARALQDISTNIGDVFRFKLDNVGSETLSYEIGTDTGSVIAGSSLNVNHTATASTTDIQLKNFSAGTTASGDNISLQRLLEAS